MTDPRRCVAVADYVAKKDDELTFKTGEIIYVPKRTNEERWQGVLHGKVGWFPRVYVDDRTVEVKAGKTTRVRAIRPYEAETDEELSFPKDAVMFVVARENEQYWRGVYDGKPGLIVASHVEDASETPKDEAKFEGAKCRAVRSHVPTTDDELAFKVGDTVFVPKPDKTLEMWKGVCNSEIGVFPASKVVDVAERTEEELQKIIEENSKLTDEEAAKQALAKREEAKRLALEKQTALGNVYKADDTSTSQQGREESTNDRGLAKNTEEQKEAEAEKSNIDGAPAEDAAATTHDTQVNDKQKREEQQQHGAAETDEFAGLSAKERKALEKKKAKEEKRRLKEEQKKKKQEEKLAKKRAKEEAKRRKEEEKKSKGGK